MGRSPGRTPFHVPSEGQPADEVIPRGGEDETVELPAQLAKDRRDLDGIPPTEKTRREFVEREIRFAEKRTDMSRLGDIARWYSDHAYHRVFWLTHPASCPPGIWP